MPRKKSPKKRRKNRFLSRIKLYFVLLLIAMSIPTVNWLYQVVKKPTEVVGLFDKYFYKTPHETWSNYSDLFGEHSTNILTPHYLAALAQTESQGNPIARTYWSWKLTGDWTRLFAPASSSVGLFQMTDATFEEAKRFCIQNGSAVHEDDYRSEFGGCWFNWAYMRLWPSHAIEMTSARLHFVVEELLNESQRKASLIQKQKLAAIVHLCGRQKGRRLIQLGFNTRRIGKCGSHKAAKYVSKVFRMKNRFQRLAQKHTNAVTSN